MRQWFHRGRAPETRKRHEAGFSLGRGWYSPGVLEAERMSAMESDRIEGKAKKWEGKLTGDESREAEGRLQEQAAKVKDAPRDAWEAVKDKAGQAYNEREERKER
jgi:uncharacterized protein YjbJ (UPF0337 family)